MPVWVWIVLVVWFLVAIGIGLAYVAVHGLRALRSIQSTLGHTMQPLERLQESEIAQEYRNVLEESFEQTRQRYLSSQERIRAHRVHRREAHMQVWKRWYREHE